MRAIKSRIVASSCLDFRPKSSFVQNKLDELVCCAFFFSLRFAPNQDIQLLCGFSDPAAVRYTVASICGVADADTLSNGCTLPYMHTLINATQLEKLDTLQRERLAVLLAECFCNEHSTVAASGLARIEKCIQSDHQETVVLWVRCPAIEQLCASLQHEFRLHATQVVTGRGIHVPLVNVTVNSVLTCFFFSPDATECSCSH